MEALEAAGKEEQEGALARLLLCARDCAGPALLSYTDPLLICMGPQGLSPELGQTVQRLWGLLHV